MGDSTAMTVEFLRARLLSERSVSRTARQRADQLAKRVVELEEQLRIVAIQRRKAEKAVAEVISILEAEGLSDLSEVVDSSSEQDPAPSEQKRGDDTVKEDGSSTTSRIDKSEVDDGHSGSEPEVSASQVRNLSWKGNGNSQGSIGKKKYNQNRQRQRRSSSVNARDSPKKQPVGKSCRKNKCKDMGYATEEGKIDSHIDDFHGQAASFHVGDIPNGLDNDPDVFNGSSGNNDNKAHELVLCSGDDQSKNFKSNIQETDFSKHEDMEQALEKKAQLILLYQAEENSQREWEEEFNKSNCSKMDHTEQQNNEMTRNGSELKEENVMLLPGETSNPEKEMNCCSAMTDANLHDNQDTAPKSDSLASTKCSNDKGHKTLTISNSFSFHNGSAHCGEPAAEIHSVGLGNQNQRQDGVKSIPLESSVQDIEFPDQVMFCRMEKGSIQYLHDDNSGMISKNSSLQPRNNGFTGSPSSESLSSVQSSLRYSRERLQAQNQFHTPVHQNRNNGMEVLDALRRAKMSLKEELDRSTIQNKTSRIRSANSDVSTLYPKDILGVPFGSAGLFRLPTDPPQPGFTRSDLSRPNSDLEFASSSQRTLGHYADIGYRITPPGINDFGLQISPDIKMPACISVHSSPSPDFQRARTFDGNFQKNYVDMRGGGYAGSQCSYLRR